MFPAYFCDVGCVKTAHLSFTRMEIFLFHHQNENWDDLNLVLQNKVVVPERQDPMLVLKFIWMEKNIGIALDQLVPGYGSIPLSPYYFWPRKDAWEELRAKLEEKEWISQKQMIILLNQATDIINLWQQGGGSLSTWVPPHPVLSTLQACVLLVSLHALSVVNVKVMVRGLVDRFNQFSVMDFFFAWKWSCDLSYLLCASVAFLLGKSRNRSFSVWLQVNFFVCQQQRKNQLSDSLTKINTIFHNTRNCKPGNIMISILTLSMSKTPLIETFQRIIAMPRHG